MKTSDLIGFLTRILTAILLLLFSRAIVNIPISAFATPGASEKLLILVLLTIFIIWFTIEKISGFKWQTKQKTKG